MTADREIQCRLIRPFLENRQSDFLYIPASRDRDGALSSLLQDMEKGSHEKGFWGGSRSSPFSISFFTGCASSFHRRKRRAPSPPLQTGRS